MRKGKHVCEIEEVLGEGIFVQIDGSRIAARGPGRTWIPLKSGWMVLDLDDEMKKGIIDRRNTDTLHY